MVAFAFALAVMLTLFLDSILGAENRLIRKLITTGLSIGGKFMCLIVDAYLSLIPPVVTCQIQHVGDL
jgi:hypothetical protein